MKYIQVDQNDDVSIVDVGAAYPDGAFEIIKPIMEKTGYLFLDYTANHKTKYNRNTATFYDPEEPIVEEKKEINDNLAILDGIAGTYEKMLSLETNQTAIMEGLTALYEEKMKGANT